MAQTQQSTFQLFPTVQPQNHPPSGQPKKGHKRRSTKSPNVSPVIEDVKIPGQTEAVILQIIEDTNMIVPPPPARTTRSGSPAIASNSFQAQAIVMQASWSRQTPSPSQGALPPAGSVAKNGQGKGRSFSTPSPAPSFTCPIPAMAAQNANGAVKGVECSSPSPDLRSEPPRCDSGASVRSIVEPPSSAKNSAPSSRKSIFPLYDPNVPLERQRYYPRRTSSLPQIIIPSTGQKTVPQCMPVLPKATGRPVSTRNERVSFCSADTLTQLWDAANGGVLQPCSDIINLRMWKADAFTFKFGSRSAAFYTLRTNPMNDIEVHRTHPSKPNTKSPVVTLNIGDLGQSPPTGIGLALFPKLAEIVTREHTLDLARQHQLSPQCVMEIEIDAVRRAEAENSCILELYPGQNRYNLYYAAPDRRGIASSTVYMQSQNQHHGLLHATVSTSLPNTIAMRQYPKIQIALPNQDLNTTPPLIALDLETMALSISVEQIRSTIPSLYAIDTMVAAILTIAVSNETCKSVLAGMSIQSPQQGNIQNLHQIDPLPLETIVDKTDIQLFATQAEREEAEQEAALMDQIRSSPRPRTKQRFSLMSILGRKSDKDHDMGHDIELKTKRKKGKKKSKPVVTENIDLEYGHSEESTHAHAGKELPGPTRALLKLINWSFSVVIWVLTKGAKVMARTVIAMTKCLTRGKA